MAFASADSVGRMGRFVAGLGAVVCVASVWAFGGCGDDSSLATGDAGVPTPGPACGAPTDCASGHCVDGVCCESACGGACEACDLPGSVGRCEPVPAGQDPASDCAARPSFGPDESRKQPGACAGSCDGARACAYPGEETTCGAPLCKDARTLTRLLCDGAGSCGKSAVEACDPYTCVATQEGAACRRGCKAPSDCAETHFCAGGGAGEGTCVPKQPNGNACSSDTHCVSGVCVDGVCCNVACDGDASASCRAPGKVGTCVCTGCSGSACKAFYPDADGDGFGAKDGTPKYACADESNKPAGYVANARDCYDVAGDLDSPNVRPTQTQFFATGYGPGKASFDYDCDGTLGKETPEYPGGGCGVCVTTTIPSASAGGVVRLGPAPINCGQDDKSCSPTAQQGHGCEGPGCRVADVAAFEENVACGATASLVTCGVGCTNDVPNETSQPKQQRCR